MSNIVSAFNEHFTDFMNDIIQVFPEDSELKIASNALSLIMLTSSKMIIRIFKTTVVTPYRKQIYDGDISFFIEKDYSQELDSNAILDKINILREPIRNMDVANKNKTVQYIQNLSKLCDLFEK